MQQHVQKGGVTHYYFDISFSRSTADLLAGFGYRLPDNRVQPGSMDGTLREWYKRVWALMAENGLYPGAVSGHSTHSIALRALPWTDSILDSEYPMKDPVTVYTMDSMIAMSCPHAFGVNISHLGFMLPEWASLHDSAIGGSGYPFNSRDFRHFGITAGDVVFHPYWRNQKKIVQKDSGVIASAWTRPNTMILQVMNYGIAPDGEEPVRAADAKIDLKAFGINPKTVRIREIRPADGRISRLSAIFDWYQALPDAARWPRDEEPKVRPDANPAIDASGNVTGIELFYHDSRYFLITWDDKSVDRAAVVAQVGEVNADAAIEWGIERAKECSTAALGCDNEGVTLKVWTQPGTAMILVKNGNAALTTVTINADLAALGVDVPKIWTAYAQCIGGTLSVPDKTVTLPTLPADASRLVFIDTFAE